MKPNRKFTKSERKPRRSFPHHTLEEALVLPQKIADEMGGKPFRKILLAEAVGLRPSSSNFRDLLSSAFKYNLTDGTEKASSIGLTDLGSRTSVARFQKRSDRPSTNAGQRS